MDTPMRIAPMRARALPLPTERRDGACLARPALDSQRYEPALRV
jgi:hypothetical protein